MKKVGPILIVLSVALNVAFVSVWAVHAFSRHRRPCTPHGCHGEGKRGLTRMHRELDVTEEQWKKIEPRLGEFRKASGKACRDVYRLRLELIDLLAAPEVDREAVQAKRDEILDGQRNVQDLAIQHIFAERDVLTPEQRTKLFRLMKEQTRCPGHGALGNGEAPSGPGSCSGCGTAERPCGSEDGT
jgi:Spy/CpxP family protein refolding chaperone